MVGNSSRTKATSATKKVKIRYAISFPARCCSLKFQPSTNYLVPTYNFATLFSPTKKRERKGEDETFLLRPSFLRQPSEAFSFFLCPFALQATNTRGGLLPTTAGIFRISYAKRTNKHRRQCSLLCEKGEKYFLKTFHSENLGISIKSRKTDKEYPKSFIRPLKVFARSKETLFSLLFLFLLPSSPRFAAEARFISPDFPNGLGGGGGRSFLPPSFFLLIPCSFPPRPTSVVDNVDLANVKKEEGRKEKKSGG